LLTEENKAYVIGVSQALVGIQKLALPLPDGGKPCGKTERETSCRIESALIGKKGGKK
jgi:hypothetical protein